MLFLSLLSTLVSTVCLCGDPPRVSRELLMGSFEVTEHRVASDTPSTLGTQEASGRYLATSATFAKTAHWRDGIACSKWDLVTFYEPAPEDVSLSGLLPRGLTAGWAKLMCDGQEVDRIFVVDGRRILSRTPNGATWLVWSRSAWPEA